jgi:chromosome segregation ATPase
MYHINSNVQDVQSAIDEAESQASDLRSTPIEDAPAHIDNLLDTISRIDSELRYVSSDIEDLEALRDEWEDFINEYDCAADVPVLTEEESDEYEKLKAERDFFERDKEQMDAIVKERDALRKQHENQRLTIQKLFDKLAGLHEQTSLDSVIETISDLPVADDKQLVKLPPNCS